MDLSTSHELAAGVDYQYDPLGLDVVGVIRLSVVFLAQLVDVRPRPGPVTCSTTTPRTSA